VLQFPAMTLGIEIEDDAFSWTGPDRFVKATWVFVWLGVLLRMVTFALNFPLWGDEAFVAVNLISRGYRDLLRPLDYAQICPLLFLWLELTAVKLLGFSEWSLRLIPTIASVGGVFLFAHIVGRVTRGPARMLAVGIFSMSYYPIRHGAEVKQYSTDLFASLILIALAVEWLRAPQKKRWLWALAAAVPLALALSHPAVFVGGAITLALAATVWDLRENGALIPFAIYNLAMVGTFLGLFTSFTSEQESAYLSIFRSNYWAAAFPPLTQPMKLAGWLAEAHTGRMFAHPFGEARGGSSLTTLCFTVALVALWRRRQFALIVLALGPFGLAFIASVLGRYPYGGSARTMIFVAPMICLLSGLGLAVMIGRLRLARARRLAVFTTALGLAMTGIVMLGLKIAFPYKSIPDQNSRAFARSFWTEKALDSQLICVKSDLGLGFNRRNWLLFRSALYLCNQKIYSPRHRLGGGINWDMVSAARPLRCVLYNEWPENSAACSAWLRQMSERFRVQDRQTFVINASSHRDDGTDVEDRYTIFDFVPKQGESTRQIARDSSSKATVGQY
jgi:4-amino-4-deoxy-L-arabinose transferase-like glycosyltransferase